MSFEARLLHGTPVLLDGAMGTELERRGFTAALPLWSAGALLREPEAVIQIHAEYVLAGAEVLTANTFRTNVRALEKSGQEDRDAALTARAVEMAREAARPTTRPVWVAGSCAPVEDCYRPELVPSDYELEQEHARHMENLKSAGVDFVLIETMNTAREAVIAMRAARDAGHRAGVSFILRDADRLLGGHSLEMAVDELAPLEPLFLGLNCCSPALSADGLRRVRTFWPGPVAVYANLGRVDSAGVWHRSDGAEETRRYRQAAREWVQSGARMIGGCCGTTPALIAALRKDLGSAELVEGEGAAS